MLYVLNHKSYKKLTVSFNCYKRMTARIKTILCFTTKDYFLSLKLSKNKL